MEIVFYKNQDLFKSSNIISDQLFNRFLKIKQNFFYFL